MNNRDYMKKWNEITQELEKLGISVEILSDEGYFEIPIDFNYSSEVKTNMKVYNEIQEEINGLPFRDSRLKGLQKERDKYEYYEKALEEILNSLGVSKIREVVSYGGEGMGEEYWIVNEITLLSGESFLVKTEGFYQSYNGVEWCDGYGRVVTPKKVERVVYE